MGDSVKVIGLLQAWGAKDWIVPAMRQAAAFCDEAIVNVMPLMNGLDEFEDGTYDKACEALDFLPKHVKLIGDMNVRSTYHEARPVTLNMMLDVADCYEPGNWVWILDVDEFYSIRAFRYIKYLLNTSQGRFNKLGVKEKFFLIDTTHFLRGYHWRFFRIGKHNMFPDKRFLPTQRWYKPNERAAFVEEEYGMFHYSLLTNPHLRDKVWELHYPGRKLEPRRMWLDYIYRNYDLENEDYWNEENRKLFGIKGPLFNDDPVPDKDGKFFRYVGKHPEAFEGSGLKGIKDFRKFYNFLPGDKDGKKTDSD